MPNEPKQFPNRDLRAMDQWLRSLAVEGTPLGKYRILSEEPQKLHAKVRDVLTSQRKVERDLLASNGGVDSAIKDRPLDYPFTKGISVLNDGVAYGEVIYEKRAQCAASSQLRVRRTKTGRIEFRPDPARKGTP
jgi:hypothetical protein